MSDSPVVPLRRREPVLLRHVIGSALRRERQRQRRTLDDVAVRAGVSIQYLSEIERGLKEPSSEVVAAVCASLGGQLIDLVGAVHVELSSDSVSQRSYRRVPNITSSSQPQLLAA